MDKTIVFDCIYDLMELSKEMYTKALEDVSGEADFDAIERMADDIHLLADNLVNELENRYDED